MMYPGHIYLIGMMGAGKTSTARELGFLLQKPVFDLDAELEKQTGKSIAEIFKTKGEEEFRKLETSILVNHNPHTDSIVATGGGVILTRENRDWMRSTGRIIYLEASLEQLWARVSKEKGRPLLEDADPKRKLMSIMISRQPLYEECASLKVLTDGKTPQEVALEVQKKLTK